MIIFFLPLFFFFFFAFTFFLFYFSYYYYSCFLAVCFVVVVALLSFLIFIFYEKESPGKMKEDKLMVVVGSWEVWVVKGLRGGGGLVQRQPASFLYNLNSNFGWAKSGPEKGKKRKKTVNVKKKGSRW